MSTSASTTGSQDSSTHSGPAEAAERTAAIALWVVVGVGLVYGISETAVRVASSSPEPGRPEEHPPRSTRSTAPSTQPRSTRAP